MKKRFKILFAFFVASFVSITTNQTAFAQNAMTKTKPATYTVKQIFNFDIAGVKLGMSAAQATSALQSRGYSVKNTYYNRTFETRVQEKIAERNHRTYYDGDSFEKSVSRIDAMSPSGEVVEVNFMASPLNTDGLMVAKISITFNDSFDVSATEKAIYSKYGNYTWFKDVSNELWRDDRKPYDYYWSSKPSNYPFIELQPYLNWNKKNFDKSAILTLDYSGKYEEILKKLVEDEATRRQPLNTKPNF